MYPYKRRCDRCDTVGEQRSVDSFYCPACQERAKARRSNAARLDPGMTLPYGRLLTVRKRKEVKE